MTEDQPRRRRHSPAVYRRRRLVLLLGIVVIAVVVWLLIAQPWRSTAAEASASPAAASSPTATPAIPALSTPLQTQTPDASAEPDPSPSETATEAAPAATAAAVATACVAGDVQVTAVTDAETYPSGQNPQFSISLTNRSGKDCSMNVGTSTQSFTVMSGSDVWWRSTDCQTEPSDMVVLLAAGQTVTSAAPLTWDRTRSAVGSCDASDRQRAPGGGASYHLSVSIGGISSTTSSQILLY